MEVETSPRAPPPVTMAKISVGSLIQTFSPPPSPGGGGGGGGGGGSSPVGPMSPGRVNGGKGNLMMSPRSPLPPLSPRAAAGDGKEGGLDKKEEATTSSSTAGQEPKGVSSPRSPQAPAEEGGVETAVVSGETDGDVAAAVVPACSSPVVEMSPRAPSPRSPLTLSAPSVDRPRSRSGGASPRTRLPARDDIVRPQVAGDAVVASTSLGTTSSSSSGSSSSEELEGEVQSPKNESDSLAAEKNEKSEGGAAGPNAASPRSAGKDGDWKRKALTGKGIVRENGAAAPARVKLTSLMNSIETDRVQESKSDSWKAKALTGRGIIPSQPDASIPSSGSVSMPSSSPPLTNSLSAPISSVPVTQPATLPATSISLNTTPVAQKTEEDGGKKGSSKKSKQEKRLSKKEEKKKNKDKVQLAPTAVSLPTTVVNRVHVDKDILAQDMDGVLLKLRNELERLNDRQSEATEPQPVQRGGLRKHRRSKSIDQLTQAITPKPTKPGKPDVTSEQPAEESSEPAGPTNDAEQASNKPAGERKQTKTNSMRQQLLLGKGVVKNDKRTVPVSRLSVLIDLADIQSANQQLAGRSFTPSPGIALLNSVHKPTKEDLEKQRLKTVKAVIASAMDEIQSELMSHSAPDSYTDEEQLLIFGAKLHQINELLA